MGQLPFFFLNVTSLSHCIWLACLLPGNGKRREEGSCGGMIWYELKLFPNRLHRVWSSPLLVWWILSTSINQRSACITLHQLFSFLFFLFFTTANNNKGFIFSMTLWLKVPRPCYLWLVERGLCNSFPMQRCWRGPPEGPGCRCHSSSASSRRSLARGGD